MNADEAAEVERVTRILGENLLAPDELVLWRGSWQSGGTVCRRVAQMIVTGR